MSAKKAQHTPGPWKVGELSGEVLNPKGYAVAAVPDSAGEPELEQWAIDARLIAAAPELLAALQHLLAWHRCECRESDPYFEDVLAEAKDAIRKAKAGAK